MFIYIRDDSKTNRKIFSGRKVIRAKALKPKSDYGDRSQIQNVYTETEIKTRKVHFTRDGQYNMFFLFLGERKTSSYRTCLLSNISIQCCVIKYKYDIYINQSICHLFIHLMQVSLVRSD